MAGFLNALFAVGGATVSFSTIGVSNTTASPTSATAGFEFRRDGTLYSYVNPGAGYTLLGDWVTPKHSTVGDGYWIRVTATAGAFTTSPGAGWLQLSTARYWDEQATVIGPQETTFTVEIATDSGGTNVVFTKTGNTVLAEML